MADAAEDNTNQSNQANANLNPQLQSIFADIENSLPTIDFDASDVSSEEDIAIFQRHVKPEAIEDEVKEFSATVSEDLWADVFQGGSSLSSSEGGRGSPDLSRRPGVLQGCDPIVPVTSSGASIKGFSPWSENRIQDPECTVTGVISTDGQCPEAKYNNWVDASTMLSAGVDNEKRKDIPEICQAQATADKHVQNETLKKSNSKQNKTANKAQQLQTSDIVSRYITEPPQLTIENALRQITIEDEANAAGGASGPIIHIPEPIPVDERGDDDGTSILQKLAAQSGAELNDIDPDTGAIRKRRPRGLSLKEAKTAQNLQVQVKTTASCGTSTSSMGTSTSDLSSISKPVIPFPRRRFQKKDEKETVFMDLRESNNNKGETDMNFEAIQRILRLHAAQNKELQTDSESDSDGDEQVLWHEQRRRIKEALRSGKPVPDITKLVPKNKKSTDISQRPKGEAVARAQRLARSAPPSATTEVTASPTQEGVVMSPEVVSPVQSPTKPPIPPDAAGDKEKQKRLEIAKKLREQKENERQSRIRLGKRLDASHPTTSVKGKQSPAEELPTVFDIEASYEPAPLSIPPELPADLECVLLTVHLSSNGEIIQHRGSSRKTVDTGVGISMSYAALITWLLSLVPDDFSFLVSQPAEPPFLIPSPFWVIGLQQIFMEDELCLYIAVCPRETYTQKDTGVKARKSKKRDEVKHNSPFQQIISKFLSTNKLKTIAPWLLDLTPIHISTSGSSGKPFIYAPKEASITDKPLSTYIHVHPDPTAVKKIFSIPVGFFWQTIETEELQCDVNIRDEEVNYDTQNTMSLVYKKVYRDHSSMMAMLSRIIQDGFDLSGIRLLYPTSDLMKMTEGGAVQNAKTSPDKTRHLEVLNNIGPILSLAIRGTFARSLWIEAVGPSDPVLARRTDPGSLIAQFGGESREESLIFVPRNPARVSQELARWFGGRVPSSGVIDIGKEPSKKERHNSGSRPASAESGGRPGSGGKSGRPSSAGKKRKQPQQQQNDEELVESEIPTNRPPATLTATTRSDIFLVISPLLPVKCLGLILAACQRRGYQLRGVRRMKMNLKRCSSLGISGHQATIFSNNERSSATVADASLFTDTANAVLYTPCTVLLLNKENALHSSGAMLENFMVQMSLINLLGDIQGCLSIALESDHLFHVLPYTEGYMSILGGNFSKVPESDLSAPGYIAPQIHSNPETEQIVVLTLTGHLYMKTFGLFLGRLLGVVPYSKSNSVPTLGEGFELLGVKWLPSLSPQYAKELTPYEVGDKEWKSSIQGLTSEPAVVLVLRGVNAFSRMEDVVKSRGPHQHTVPPVRLDKIMSPTPELAFRLCGLFFHDKELFADDASRPMLPFLAPNRDAAESPTQKALKSPTRSLPKLVPDHVDESVFQTMLSGPRLLTTVLVAKPDVVRRHLGKLLKRVSLMGFSVVGCKLKTLSLDEADAIVPPIQNNEELKKLHIEYMTSYPCLVLVLQRENAVRHLLDLLGPSDPQAARRQSQQFWRAVFGVDPVMNGLHGSANYGTAVEELKMFFPEGLCSKPNLDLQWEQISCPAVDTIVDVKHVTNREAVLREISTNGKGDEVATALSSSLSSSGNRNLIAGTTISMLTQTNCIVFPPSLLMAEGRSKKYGYVELIDGLLTQGFLLVGIRMVWFTQQQAEYYLHLCDAGSFALVPMLTSAPSLVVAVQRDNAVMAFDTLLGSSYNPSSLFAKYGSQILRPKDVKQACQHLAFFFDVLTPGAQAEIIDKSGIAN